MHISHMNTNINIVLLLNNNKTAAIGKIRFSQNAHTALLLLFFIVLFMATANQGIKPDRKFLAADPTSHSSQHPEASDFPGFSWTSIPTDPANGFRPCRLISQGLRFWHQTNKLGKENAPYCPSALYRCGFPHWFSENKTRGKNITRVSTPTWKSNSAKNYGNSKVHAWDY